MSIETASQVYPGIRSIPGSMGAHALGLLGISQDTKYTGIHGGLYPGISRD